MRRSIIGIVPDVVEMYRTCAGTMSAFIDRGYAAYVLVVQQGRFVTEERQSLKEQCKRARISDVFFLEGFDYSGVTQHNADLINSFIRRFKPSTVIMPYWKSTDISRKILARCALIACRGIGTILMYAIDYENEPEYSPSVFVRISQAAAVIKQQYAGGNLLVTPSHQEKARAEDDLQSSRISVGSHGISAPAMDDVSSNTIQTVANLGHSFSTNRNTAAVIPPQIGQENNDNHDGPITDAVIKSQGDESSQTELVSGKSRTIQPKLEVFMSHRMLLLNDETEW